ncbi:TIGR01621 family pseudouridine synthase [Thalassotalea ponticola]|uniref:TIGR01621 family pseudouridine synthase n=1 Tax=Thalassotalea ponticola TaxID=1523392 RepID=UPI0025B46A3E|nr:TIGR01621 family pseudouridine synthase [Thalassotalea ponticola]MDN3653910.1 TIGR01621 family pseudouridine synthase [Thalassotalea ponticola]
MTINTIFDHPDFIVVNKPANINFHDEGELGQGFFNSIKKQLSLSELYPVHRLDKMTSGLVIFAKNPSAAREFGELFKQRTIDKYYLAISKQKPKKKQGMISGDMQKSRRGSYKLMRSNINPAKTRFFSYAIGDGLRLFVLKPLTGKTHQLRVALASIGSHIAGDPLYNSNDQSDRGYLHAWALRFNYHGEEVALLCPPVSGELFLRAKPVIEDIDTPWQLPWPNT